MKLAYANLDRMPLLTKIHASFWDCDRVRFPKKSKAQKHIEIDAMLRSDFFAENALGDGPAFSIFSGFTDKGKNLDKKWKFCQYKVYCILTEI